MLLKFENSNFYSFHCFQNFSINQANLEIEQMFLLIFFINLNQSLALLSIPHLQTFRIHHSYNQKNYLYYFVSFFSSVNFLNHRFPPLQNQNINCFLFFKLEILVFYVNFYNHFQTSSQSSYQHQIDYFIFQNDYFNYLYDHH